MPIDAIVVLVLAIGFFGGIAFVYRKSRQAEQKTGKALSTSASDSLEDDLSKKSQVKNRKNS